MRYGFRSKAGKAIVAYWVAAHSLPGNMFPTSMRRSRLRTPVFSILYLLTYIWRHSTARMEKGHERTRLEGLPVTDGIWPSLMQITSTGQSFPKLPVRLTLP